MNQISRIGKIMNVYEYIRNILVSKIREIWKTYQKTYIIYMNVIKISELFSFFIDSQITDIIKFTNEKANTFYTSK